MNQICILVFVMGVTRDGLARCQVMSRISFELMEHSISKYRAIKCVKMQGSAGRRKGSGHPVTAKLPANQEYVDAHVESEDGQPGTYLTCSTMVVQLSSITVEQYQRVTKSVKSFKILDSSTIIACIPIYKFCFNYTSYCWSYSWLLNVIL